MNIRAWLLVWSSILLWSSSALAQPPESCVDKYVGSWTIRVKSTGQTYPSQVNANGTLNSTCFMCMSVQRWTCNGDNFILLDPYQVISRLSPDGLKLDSTCCLGTRNGPPPQTAERAPQPAPSPSPNISGNAGSDEGPLGLRWERNPSKENCDKANNLSRTTAAYDLSCGHYYRSATLDAPSQRPNSAPDRRPPGSQPASPSVPPAVYNDDDDGKECGNYGGHRARGKCFIVWKGNDPDGCGRIGGTYYPQNESGPAFCAYDQPANPHQPQPDMRGCERIGGSMQNGMCWIIGLTREDCAGIPGKIINSAGYQYCAYDPAAAARAEAEKQRREHRDRIRKLLMARFKG